MSRMKSILAGLMLTAIACLVPLAQAQTLTVKVVIAGSSAMWQTMALGAYNGGTSIVTGGLGTCHWTSASNKVNLVDTRTTTPNVDAGTVWVVWDNACGTGANATTNVWIYDKVDSVVGDRCYFAAPKCEVTALAADVSTTGAGQIVTSLWGSDSAMPANIQALFTSGATLVSVAATDIRPEDAAFAACRVNSALGASAQGGGLSDGTDGLGYNSNNAAGVCPVYAAATAQAKGLGNPIKSGVIPATGATANVLAFNLTGHDPITNTVLPAAYTVTAVGASPMVFVIERDKGQLTNVTNATENQLQAVFSGTDCNGDAFNNGTAGGINVFLREPLSGTMNTVEATVFRRPTIYPTAPGVHGVSQELNVGLTNPLATACTGGGHRYRGIGSGEVIKNGLSHSGDGTYPNSVDGIAYTFFSYGNVSSVANAAKFGYLTLNGVDPIFATYGSQLDPGQPSTDGVIPSAANLPASCSGAFPCPESAIWANGFSFPNLRNGTYRAWSLLRLVSFGTPSTNAAALAKASNKFVVTSIPDYVPAVAVTGTTDLGLKLLRSHYQQKDGAGVLLGKAPTNVPEAGGDMGGAIIPTTIGVTTEKQTKLIQSSTPDSLGLVVRP